MTGPGPNPDPLLGDRMSASAECRHGPPVTALSLGGLRRRIEIALMPDDVHVVLQLDLARAAGVAMAQGRQAGPRAGVAAVVGR